MGLENQVLVQTQSIHLGNSETATRGPRPVRQGAKWTNPSPSDLCLPGCVGCRVRGPLCSPAEVHLTLSSPTGWPHRDHVPSPWRGSSVSPLTPEFGPCPAAPPHPQPLSSEGGSEPGMNSIQGMLAMLTRPKERAAHLFSIYIKMVCILL